MRRLVFGILAHVDSGKTTLSEGLLYHTGQIRKLGRVDHKDAFLDTHSIERDRGITIFSKQAILKYQDTLITLLDTPGHVDFSTEMERTLSVLDYAILVISGTDGVQSHTVTLWKLLHQYQIPTFIFINKMDLVFDGKEQILSELKEKLDPFCVDFSTTPDMEELALCDEQLMEEYLECGTVSDNHISNAVTKRKLYPCFYGSALKTEGIQALIDGILAYAKEPVYPEEFGAKIFKIAEDEQGNRLTYLKITGGSLKVKAVLKKYHNGMEIWGEKINQIRIYSGAGYETADQVQAGTVCAVTGLTNSRVGDGFGFEKSGGELYTEPVLSYRVELCDGTDVSVALGKLRQLEAEDPCLHLYWNEQLKEIHVQLMGEVQLEVLKRIAKERFGMEIAFGHGSIAYKETILNSVEGVGHYEPLRHYAEVHLLLEPLAQGSGLVFVSNLPEDKLDKNWQRLILTHLSEKTHLGVLTGSPITDIKISLIAGKAHLKHTEGGDFRQATYRAVRQGLMSAKSQLLEPWYEFELELPSDTVGKAMTDIGQMGGSFEQSGMRGEHTVLTGTAPVSKMRDYQMEVIRYTRGMGRLSCRVTGYAPCEEAEKIIADTGYQPEQDLENTPDSVFCSRGAGFTVKWNEVPNFMHLESGILREESPKEPVRQARRYLERVYDDEELLAVFERTYGPIRRRERDAFRPRSKPAETVYKPKPFKPIPEGPEYLLVDGYNIIFAWKDLKKLAEESPAIAREHLIDRLCNYQGFSQCELILVFDAYKVKNNPGDVEKIHNISVVYTKEAETADMYIEKVTKELGKRHRVRVATSDNLEQLIILGHGALRISADQFLKEVEEAEKTIRDLLEQIPKGES